MHTLRTYCVPTTHIIRNAYCNNPSPQHRSIEIIPSLYSALMNIQLGDFKYYYAYIIYLYTCFFYQTDILYGYLLRTRGGVAVKHLPVYSYAYDATLHVFKWKKKIPKSDRPVVDFMRHNSYLWPVNTQISQ